MTLGAERSRAIVRAPRLMTAACVLAVGVCAALPFRQPSRPKPNVPLAAAPLELALHAPDLTLEPRPATDRSPAIDLAAATSVAKPAVFVEMSTHATNQRVTLETLSLPPELPVAFQPRSEAPAPASAASDSANAGPSEAARGKSARSRRGQPKTYRLRDGDTLESIAERFLGNRQHAAEIFEINRAALVRPDLLPVGTTIVIPPRGDAPELAPSENDS